MNRYLKGCLFVILSATIFGCASLFVKNIYLGGGNAISIVFYRNFLPLPFLYFILQRKKINLKLSRAEFGKLFLCSAIGAVLTPIVLYSSFHYINSGMATTLHFIYPVFVFLFCWLFFREKIAPLHGACLILCMLGVFFCYTPGQQANLRGIFLACASGVSYAAYIVYLAKSGIGKLDPFKYSFYIASICSVLIFLYSMLTQSFVYQMTSLAWLWMVVFAMLLTLVAVVLFQSGTNLVGAQHTAILSTFEPLASIVVGVLAFHERFTTRTLLGTIMILASVVLLTLFHKREEETKETKKTEKKTVIAS
ncbi:MAG: EamA family transporter [Negativicutes bacterium]|nr:EamA family transporter [Negativicutes bacterium]